jgi:hypothetical protein
MEYKQIALMRLRGNNGVRPLRAALCRAEDLAAANALQAEMVQWDAQIPRLIVGGENGDDQRIGGEPGTGEYIILFMQDTEAPFA